MAEVMEELDHRAARLDLSSQELNDLARDYREMAGAIASAAREAAAAAQANDSARLNAATEVMERATAREDKLVESINRYCRASQ
jgi:hypothetical protein